MKCYDWVQSVDAWTTPLVIFWKRTRNQTCVGYQGGHRRWAPEHPNLKRCGGQWRKPVSSSLFSLLQAEWRPPRRHGRSKGECRGTLNIVLTVVSIHGWLLIQSLVQSFSLALLLALGKGCQIRIVLVVVRLTSFSFGLLLLLCRLFLFCR